MTHLDPARPSLLAPRPTLSFYFHLRVFLVYGVIAWGILGLGIPSMLAKQLVGQGPDPSLFVWFFAWWPTHWLHPWHTSLLWAPTGVYLGWVTTVPLLALLAAPLTLLTGPIVSYNLMMWLGLCVTAFSTYLLGYECHHRPRLAMVQGLIVGISPYLIGQAWDGHLNLVWMPIPLLTTLIALKFWRGQLALSPMVILVTASVVLQFFVSTEVLATFTLILALGMVLTSLVPGSRPHAMQLLKAMGFGYGVAAVVLSPWLYHMFQHVAPAIHASPIAFSINPLNWILPTRLTLGGQFFARISSWFPGNLGEASGYLGFPWLLVLMVQIRHQRIRRTCLAMGYALLTIIMILALGPKLHWYRDAHGWLPESLISHLPLLSFALPSRLMFYAEVVAVFLLTPALTYPGWARWFRVSIAGVIILSLLPNFWLKPGWTQRVHVPDFYHQGVVSKILARHTTVLLWPYNTAGLSMVWQATSHFWFRMAGGYIAPAAPSPYDTWPFVSQMATLPWQYGPYWRSNLTLFLSTNRVRAVLTPLRPSEKVQKLLTEVGLKPSVRSGVVVWSGLSPNMPRDGAVEASAISTLSLLKMLITGASKYVQQQHAVQAMDPRRLEQDGDLPGFFGYYRHGVARYSVPPFAFIGPGTGRNVVIGTLASTNQLPLLTPFLSQFGTVHTIPIPNGQGGQALVTLQVIIPESKLQTASLAR